ncbi:MAG: cytochrome c [Solirubrobacterales bacterium]|nr:cytochrome c [Solirubrobacterales bacterium]
MRRRPLMLLAALAASGTLVACGEGDVPPQTPKSLPNESADVKAGAALFSERCSGCHTLDAIDAEGSATKVRDRERVDGPNLNARAQTKDAVLYAIRNGGFSGAIMPENIVVGKQAEQVAEFLVKYAGKAGQSGSESDQSTGSR